MIYKERWEHLSPTGSFKDRIDLLLLLLLSTTESNNGGGDAADEASNIHGHGDITQNGVRPNLTDSQLDCTWRHISSVSSSFICDWYFGVLLKMYTHSGRDVFILYNSSEWFCCGCFWLTFPCSSSDCNHTHCTDNITYSCSTYSSAFDWQWRNEWKKPGASLLCCRLVHRTTCKKKTHTACTNLCVMEVPSCNKEKMQHQHNLSQHLHQQHHQQHRHQRHHRRSPPALSTKAKQRKKVTPPATLDFSDSTADDICCMDYTKLDNLI